ncbi:uncharacterized protein PV07_03436 [Cladophialophora immunda]|uniref:Ricin B lectin domain-containing protein n=1 Tax=Cladophialophora immunda TaxID=569365 RepID=A0A0D2CKY3_9EURO|nr:uncharacterized protein PV07_03436 [Cladophialophora immunda]KIW31843.1 hypothetical protein PV07_03436 [Cladophialophora immunda]OQU98445.1 Ricin-type beta-trefoil lectin domain-containing protein [Cladophialophora immunda]
MVSLLYALFLGSASFCAAHPVAEKRTVTALDQASFEEAQQRDDTATRAFSSIPIKTSDGQCLFVDELSGDFRANLTPIQVAACNGSTGQQWDIITAGKHDDQPGTMLIVSTLTQACFNFDPRRAAGNQVLLFSCGGRADGSGAVTNSQLFPFSGGAGPLALSPENAPGDCLTVNGALVDIAACNTADPNQSFTFGDAGAAVSSSVDAASPTVVTDCAPVSTVTVSATSVSTATVTVISTAAAAVSTTVSTVTVLTTTATSISASVASISTTSPPVVVTSTTSTASASIISVSRAGSVLNPSAVAEANPRDDTATRAFSSVALKSASGLCLFIDPTAGDFRENLIPIVLQPCDGSPNQSFDIITAGVHNDQPNSALIVSTLTQGCLNFDPRRAAGDTVIMFSCGGRADGSGQVTNSQLFTFTTGETSLRLQPENGDGAVCLVADAAGRLDQAPCSDDPSQVFTIG